MVRSFAQVRGSFESFEVIVRLTNISHTRFRAILELKFKLRGDQSLDLHSVLEPALGWAHDSLRQPDTWYSNTVLHTVALLIGPGHFWSQL